MFRKMKTKTSSKYNLFPAFWNAFSVTIALLALTPLLQAANLTWDITSGDGGNISNGSGNWVNLGGNWNNGTTDATWNNANPDNATFGNGTNSSAPYVTTCVVTLTGGITVGNITFTNWNSGTSGTTNIQYEIAGGANTLTLSGTPTITTRSDGMLSTYIAGGFIKTGAGTLRIHTNNTTYAAGITVNEGVLQVGNADTQGDLGSSVITLAGSGSFAVRKNGNFTIHNTITGTSSGTVLFEPVSTGLPNAFTIANANTYNAATALTPNGSAGRKGILKLGISNGLPTNTDFTLGYSGTTNQMTFDLAGYNQTIGSLADSGGGNYSNYVVSSSTGSPVLTISGTKSTTFDGLITSNLSLTINSSSTLTLTASNTYAGDTTITNGVLALSTNASINGSDLISIGAGGTLDVSAISAYTLSTNLIASGSASPATIIGNASGTVSLGSQPITLNYDGINPALTVSQGPLTLNGNSLTVNKGSPLPTGDYVIITNIGNTISSNGTITVSGTAISGTVASLAISGGQVKLHLTAAPVDPTKSTVTVSPATLPADNASIATVTATIRDSGNHPISGVGVQWTVSGSGNTVNPPSAGLTAANGQVTFTVSSIKAETKTVSVTVGITTITNSLLINFTNPATPNVLAWDPVGNGTASDGAGIWDTTTANWANNGIDLGWPNNGSDAAVFGTGATLPSGNTVVTLGAPVTVGNITFNNGGTASSGQYQLAGQYITLSNSPTIYVVASALISSPLTGSGFTKDGGGTLRIDGDATNFSGAISVIGAGTLQIGNRGTNGNLGTGPITLSDPAVFTVRRQGTLVLSNTIAGSTSAGVNFQLDAGAVVTLAKANTYAANTTFAPAVSNSVGTLQLGINNGLPTNTDFTINNNGASVQTFDLAGHDQTLNSLATGANRSISNSIATNSASGITNTLTDRRHRCDHV